MTPTPLLWGRFGRPAARGARLIAFGALLGLCIVGGLAQAEAPGGLDKARADLEAGRLAQAQGDVFEARARFTAAVAAGGADPAMESEALLALAGAERAVGEVPSSVKNLQRALSLAESTGDVSRRAAIKASLGASELALGDALAAARWLEAATNEARAHGDADVLAAAENDWGILEALGGQPEAAVAHFEASAASAKAIGDVALEARALGNAARALASEQPKRAAALRKQVAAAVATLPASHARAELWVHLGEQARLSEPVSAAGRRRAAEWLYAGLETAEAVGDGPVAAQALGRLGALYAEEGRRQEALDLTDRALSRTRRSGDSSSIYRLYAQRGALLLDLGHPSEASEAYARAVEALGPLRHRTHWGGGLNASSFQSDRAPVYEALIGLQLDQAAASSEAAVRQTWLRQARDTLEDLKAAELRDYFRDDCVDALQSRLTRVESVSESAVIVYPIALQSRLVVLTAWPSGELEQHRINLERDVLEAETSALRQQLERAGTRRYLPHARTLYDWLVGPIAKELEERAIETLVFVPSGVLLTVPMAALHDGQGFLIERYALALTPGMELTDPKPFQSETPRALLAGLSEAVEGYAPLPNVILEIERVHSVLGGQVLLNSDFLRENLRSELEEKAFNVVHLATHAVFSTTGEGGFLLTYDGRLSMSGLADDIGTFRFRDQSLELLTLSACETAQGDQLAALGLSGVAVQAGARSALGTLWSVDDPATALLVGVFYQALLEPGVSKAEALRRSQRALLKDFRYRHPAYWAPFQMIGSWL